jgi:predicted nuclease of predicted toxin-antitoxin system
VSAFSPPKFLTDEDFNRDILTGLLARDPSVDVVRVQDHDLSQAPDPDVLESAARGGRVVLTHDANTMVGFAVARVQAGLPMPGLVMVRQTLTISQAIDELLILAGAGTEEDFKDQVYFVPLGSA